MDVKQESDPFDLLQDFVEVKTEPEIDSDQSNQNKFCPGGTPQMFKNEHGDVRHNTFNAFECETSEQFIKEEIEYEMPKIEYRSDLPTKSDQDTVKRELEKTSSVKEIEIKEEVSEYIQAKTESEVRELLTSHCDLPTLKHESINYPEAGYSGRTYIKKTLKNTARVTLKKKRRYGCPICQKNFPSMSSMSRWIHFDGHFEKRYAVCPFCGKFIKKVEFFQHFYIHVVKNRTNNHIGSKPSKCNQYKLRKYLISHSSEKLLKCVICFKGFKHKSNLQKHLIIHRNEKQFKCDVCSKCFNHKYILQRHLSIHSTENLFKCDICFKGFKHKYNLRKHLIIHTSETPFKCDNCSKGFKDKSNLQRHLMIHTGEKSFKCDICSKGFNRKSNLQSHLKNHRSETPFKCDICSKRFKHKSNLQKHLLIHTSETPFKCDVCSKGFNQKSILKQHFLYHSETPFKCDICSKGFKYKSDLQRHLIIHSGEKPFKCDICSKGFNRKFNLKNHLINHSSETPFKCDICSKGFKHKSDLKKHLIIHKN